MNWSCWRGARWPGPSSPSQLVLAGKSSPARGVSPGRECCPAGLRWQHGLACVPVVPGSALGAGAPVSAQRVPLRAGPLQGSRGAQAPSMRLEEPVVTRLLPRSVCACSGCTLEHLLLSVPCGLCFGEPSIWWPKKELQSEYLVITLLLLLSRSVVSDSARPQRPQPTRLPRPWDPPGKNAGVGAISFSSA